MTGFTRHFVGRHLNNWWLNRSLRIFCHISGCQIKSILWYLRNLFCSIIIEWMPKFSTKMTLIHFREGVFWRSSPVSLQTYSCQSLFLHSLISNTCVCIFSQRSQSLFMHINSSWSLIFIENNSAIISFRHFSYIIRHDICLHTMDRSMICKSPRPNSS